MVINKMILLEICNQNYNMCQGGGLSLSNQKEVHYESIGSCRVLS
jgi:hypothetical protein